MVWWLKLGASNAGAVGLIPGWGSKGLRRWLSGKESACQCRRCKRHWVIPGWGRSPGEGKGKPLQYSCQENSMGREVWCATVHGATKRLMQFSEWAQHSGEPSFRMPQGQQY